jgi:2-haloacid dehalogenase
MLRVSVLVFCCVALTARPSYPGEPGAPRYGAIAFDYFVIFDPNSIIPQIEGVFPGKGKEFADRWRARQFDYGFLRSITGRHVDFFKVTEDSLVYSAEAMKLNLTGEAKERLLNAYLI